MAGTSRRVFRAKTGISWGPHGVHSFEAGDLVTGVPAQYVPTLLADGAMEEVPATEARTEAPLTEEST